LGAIGNLKTIVSLRSLYDDPKFVARSVTYTTAPYLRRVPSMEQVREIVRTGILNSPETAEATNDPTRVESIKIFTIRSKFVVWYFSCRPSKLPQVPNKPLWPLCSLHEVPILVQICFCLQKQVPRELEKVTLDITDRMKSKSTSQISIQKTLNYAVSGDRASASCFYRWGEPMWLRALLSCRGP
jgi:hypothetical protein